MIYLVALKQQCRNLNRSLDLVIIPMIMIALILFPLSHDATGTSRQIKRMIGMTSTKSLNPGTTSWGSASSAVNNIRWRKSYALLGGNDAESAMEEITLRKCAVEVAHVMYMEYVIKIMTLRLTAMTAMTAIFFCPGLTSKKLIVQSIPSMTEHRKNDSYMQKWASTKKRSTFKSTVGHRSTSSTKDTQWWVRYTTVGDVTKTQKRWKCGMEHN